MSFLDNCTSIRGSLRNTVHPVHKKKGYAALFFYAHGWTVFRKEPWKAVRLTKNVDISFYFYQLSC